MQRLFQSSKRLITICLITLLLVTSTLVSFPAPARAAGDVKINVIDCESGSDCGNIAAFTAGVFAGSAVTILATGGGNALAAAAMSVIGAGGAAAPLAAAAVPAIAAAAPVAVPVGLTAAAGYAAYNFFTSHQNDQTQPLQ